MTSPIGVPAHQRVFTDRPASNREHRRKRRPGILHRSICQRVAGAAHHRGLRCPVRGRQCADHRPARRRLKPDFHRLHGLKQNGRNRCLTLRSSLLIPVRPGRTTAVGGPGDRSSSLGSGWSPWRRSSWAYGSSPAAHRFVRSPDARRPRPGQGDPGRALRPWRDQRR